MSPAATTALWEVAPEPDPAPPPEGFYLQTDLGHITNFGARAKSGREHGREIQGWAKKVVPRLREGCRQAQAEVVSNSKSEIHQTWPMPFFLLYL